MLNFEDKNIVIDLFCFILPTFLTFSFSLSSSCEVLHQQMCQTTLLQPVLHEFHVFAAVTAVVFGVYGCFIKRKAGLLKNTIKP